MKKIKLILTLILVATLALTLVACQKCEMHVDANKDAKCDVCGEDVPCEVHEDDDRNGECDVCGEDVEISEDYLLFKNGEAKFQIVLGSGLTSDVRKLVDEYVKTIRNLGIELKVVEDTDDTKADYEVLIGNVRSRGNDYKYDMYSLGKEGYIIKAVDTKVLIVGGSKDSLISTIKKFFDDYVGLGEKDPDIENVTIFKKDFKEAPQTGYKIEDVTIDGTSIRGYKIIAELSVAEVTETANSLQDKFYDKAGIWLPLANITSATEEELKSAIIIRSTKENIADGNGFLVSVSGKSLIIEAKYLNMLLEYTDEFFFNNISKTRGVVNLKSNFKFTKDASKVYYSDFGAVGDGLADDFAAIRAAHEAANLSGQTVCATSGAKYYIGETEGQTISVKTNVNWGTATFIFDDSIIPVESKSRDASIFVIRSDYSTTTLTKEEIAAIVDENGGISSDITKLNYAPGYKAMLIFYNSNHYQYVRFGVNASAGSAQHELVVIDENGNIDPTTPFLFDYETVTKVEVIRIDDEPITIQGGTIITKANQADSYYNYYSRNISVRRSNVTIKNLRHEITGEGDTGAPYSGFITATNCNNMRVENCKLSGHKTYMSKDPDQPSNMGTYDLGGNNANGLYYKNCIQLNFFKEDGTTPDTSLWGIMGTNYCKNITYDGSRLSRLDAHAGVYNATIIDSEVLYIHLVGGGTALIKNSTSYNYNPIINLRSDYGSPWNGNVIIDGLKVVATARNASVDYITLVSYTWVNHNFGYEVHMPKNIVIKDINVVDITNPKIYLFADPTTGANAAAVYDFTADRVEVQSPDPIPVIDPETGKQKKDANGKLMYLDRATNETADANKKYENVNRTVLTEKVIFVNLQDNYKQNLIISQDPFLNDTDRITYLYITGEEYAEYLNK